MNVARVQHAVRFLASLREDHAAGRMDHAVFGLEMDNESLLHYAAERGHDIDSDSLAEAFRMRMLARETVRTTQLRTAEQTKDC